MNFLQDIKTAIKLTGEVHKARKAGASGVQIKPVYSVPVYDLGPAWLNTMEGCLTWKLGRKTDQAVRDVFESFPRETQHRLEITPKAPGEWAERARFWQRELKPTLPPQMSHKVMALFIDWYIRCLRQRKAQERVARLLRGEITDPSEWSALTALGREYYRSGKDGAAFEPVSDSGSVPEATKAVNRFLRACWDQGRDRVTV